MKIKFFCPYWGSEDLDYISFLHKVKKAGYDGFEMILPFDIADKKRIVDTAKSLDLEIIAQWGGAIEGDFEQVLRTYEAHLRNACSVKPLFVNIQTGKDYYTYEQNMTFINLASVISLETGITVLHETHRGMFSYAASITYEFLKKNAKLRITADFSHWCCVSESLLEDQQESLNLAISRSDHIHARVGFQEGPQIPDPRTPEWKDVLETHLLWWDSIIASKKKEEVPIMTITPEFGPFPYMPKMPFTKMPISSQWDINLFIKDLLKERYS
jgi:sugar phosphate isomerase/epimerase